MAASWRRAADCAAWRINESIWLPIAAYLDRYPGRTWRPLLDTAIAAQLLYSASPAWSAWRRSVDYYDEGELINYHDGERFPHLEHDSSRPDLLQQIIKPL